MNIWIKTIGIILFFPFLAGCWDSVDVERMYYANAIAIDYKDGIYEVYTQAVNFQSMASGAEGGGQGQGPQAYVGFSKGATFGKALHNLYGHTQRKLYWGHTSAIVFTEDALKHGIEGVVELLRFHEFRHTIWFFGTKEDPKKLLSSFPIVEMSVIQSYLGEPEAGYKQSSFIEPKRMHRFFSEIHEPGSTFSFPIINLVDYWFEEEKPFPSLNIEGAGFLDDLNYKGALLYQDMYGLRWINNSTIRSPLLLKIDNEEFGTMIINNPKAKIIPNINNLSVNFNIEIKLTAGVLELIENLNETEIINIIREQISMQIRDTFLKGLEINTDVLNLSHALYKADSKKWRELTHNGQLPLNKESLADIKVDVKLIKTGKQKLRPSNDKNTPRSFWNN